MQKTTAAAALLSAVVFTGLTLAEPPTTAPAAGSPPSMAKPGDIMNKPGEAIAATEEVQHLRDARKLLNESKDEFLKYPKDKENHRTEVLDGIDKALNAINAEINELKK